VGSVLIGSRTAAEVADAVDCARRPVPPQVRQQMRAGGHLPDYVPVPLFRGRSQAQ
jgi:D-threo-aldose 1-dehydrogenase